MQLAIVLKTVILLHYLPLFMLLYLVPVTFLRRTAARVLLYIFGVFFIEDFGLEKGERGGRSTRILSNHTCFLDIIYYLYRYFRHKKISRLRFYRLRTGRD
jgi:hypothetical protein